MRVLSGGCAYRRGLRVRDSLETWIPSQVDRNKCQDVSPSELCSPALCNRVKRTRAWQEADPHARSWESRASERPGRETAAPWLCPSHVWSRWLAPCPCRVVSAERYVLPGTLGGPLFSWWPTPSGRHPWKLPSGFCRGAGRSTALLTAPNLGLRFSCGRGNSGRDQH